MTSTNIPELDTEIAYFNQHRAELFESAPGKFALIKGDLLIGIFESETTAIRHGYERLGNVPFLVQKITEADLPLTFTTFNLGV